MSELVQKYERSEKGGRLRQGEILSGVIQVRQKLDSIGSDGDWILDEVSHPFAVVLSQDCDLESDYGRDEQHRQIGSSLPSVFCCEAICLNTLKGKVPSGKDIWKRIVQNKDERYHCLEEVPSEHDASDEGIEYLGIDFKRYFTIPSNELYKRINIGQVTRRCRLLTPYAEQLAIRFFQFQCRLALPEDHSVPLSLSTEPK